MKRSERLYVLLGVLAAACAVTFGVSRYQEHKEQIQATGEIVLEVPSEEVESLSWEYDGQSFSFHKDGSWIYDGDQAFPVDGEKIAGLLEQFQSFGAAFTIQEPEDLGQYGLDDPVCTISFSTVEESYTISLGDYSTMDAQRYVSIGDGNVYLAAHDPLEEFDAELSDLIAHDQVPDFGQVTQIAFSGAEDYAISYQENGGDSYRAEDVYFAEDGGGALPLDTSRVEDYLYDLRYLGLTDYVTYDATEEEIRACGLDDPELTITVDYTGEDGDGEDAAGTFTLHVSRDPEERAAAGGEAGSEGEDEEITAYARVGESPILYRISSGEYEALMAASRDDLRHQEVLPAEFEDVSRIDVSLEGADHTITSQGEGEDRTFYYGEEALDISDLRTALTALKAEEDGFTDEQPSEREEIRLTVHLDLEGSPTVSIVLYRYDGSSCLAVVDGAPLCLVSRSSAVDLIESVNAIVLN